MRILDQLIPFLFFFCQSNLYLVVLEGLFDFLVETILIHLPFYGYLFFSDRAFVVSVKARHLI